MTEIRRPLHDGAGYALLAAAPGITTIALRDSDGDAAMASTDRAGVRQLIEDLTLIASLAPTASTMDRATALAGAVARNFQLLIELDKTNPVAATQIAESIAHHLRSWRPAVFFAAQGSP